jgi:hypothetical protein
VCRASIDRWSYFQLLQTQVLKTNRKSNGKGGKELYSVLLPQADKVTSILSPVFWGNDMNFRFKQGKNWGRDKGYV